MPRPPISFFPEPDQLGVLPKITRRGRLHLARDTSSSVVLPARWPDHHAQLVVVHEEVQIVSALNRRSRRLTFSR